MNPAALKAALNGEIANMLAASIPGGIERQEAEGQRDLCASSKVPKEVRGATREQLGAIGFKFGDDLDELFVACSLPTGWRLSATEHSMHNDLLDERGRKRAGIFYKAAFYDRRADMSMCCRYSLNPYADGADKGYMRVVATDGEAVIFDAGEWKQGDYAHSDVLRETARQWLADKHPDWQSPLAYWD